MNEKEYEALVTAIASAKKYDIKKHTEKSLERLTKAYAAEYRRLFSEILTSTTSRLGSGTRPTSADVYAVLSQIEAELSKLDASILSSVKRELESTYMASALNYVKVVEGIKAVAELSEAVPFTTINHYRVERLVSETAEDLLFASKHVNKEVKKTIQGIYAKHLQLQALRDKDYKDIIKAIEKELSSQGIQEALAKQGFTALIDKSGRRWNLSTYTNLVVTTKMQDAYHEAMKVESLERGRDLAQISRNGASDACAQFEGMVISMNGLTEGYLTYDDLKATGLIFHPYCRHTCYPLRDFDLLHESEQQEHYNQVKSASAYMKRVAKR